MRGYRYNFLDEKGLVGATLVLYSASDDAACDLASDLLSRSECAFVEVRKGASLIFQIGRGGSNSNRLASPIAAEIG